MREKFKKCSPFFLLVFILAGAGMPVFAKSPSVKLKGFNSFVNQLLQEWRVPGVAITLVKDGQVILARGYGLRDVKKNLPVTGQTLFAIGSCTKAFTATAVGVLVDRGKLKWDDPLRHHLKDFKLKDPVATRQMTAVDLMCHRSGLPRHDFAWYNAPASRRELYQRLAFLEPTEPFRYRFQYNNFMFMTAGILVEELTGKRWEDFISETLLSPLGMTRSNFSVIDSQAADDFSLPYNIKNDNPMAVPFRNIDSIGPAGCINSCARDMARWLLLNLNRGKWKGKQMISENTLAFLHTPNMVTGSPVSKEKEFLFTTYGLGWGIGSYRGAPVINHGGGIDGFVSLVSLLPRQNAGVVILTNCDSTGGYVTGIIGRNLYDRILGRKPIDWNSKMRKRWEKAQEEEKKAREKKDTRRVKGTTPSHPLEDYCGVYDNPGYGSLQIKNGENRLMMVYNNIDFKLDHYHYDVFQASIPDEDSYLVNFATDTKGMIHAVSIPFQIGVDDIVFSRVADKKMRDPEFLKRFAGRYRLNQMILTFALVQDHLVLKISGQPDHELVPYRGNQFTVKKLKGYSLEFVEDDQGAVSAVKLVQPNGVFTAEREK